MAFRAWTRSIPKIDGELLGPDGTPLPFDRSLITPYVLRHCYAQRHADAGVPVDVLKDLLNHSSIPTTMVLRACLGATRKYYQRDDPMTSAAKAMIASTVRRE